jgi:hypothetical protein
MDASAEADSNEAFLIHVAPLRDAMRTLIEEERATRQRRPALPEADSTAMAEIVQATAFTGKDPWGVTPIEAAYSLVGVSLFAAEDYMLSFCRLYDAPPFPVYGPVVLARSAFETCLTARWIIDAPQGNARARIARIMTCRLDDLRERVKVLRHVHGDAAAAEATEWFDSIVAEGERLGFHIARTKKGAVLGIESAMPSTTELAKKLFLSPPDGQELGPAVGETLWRYYSGVTHAKWYALREAMEPSDDDELSNLTGATTVSYVARLPAVLQALSVFGLAYMPASGRYHYLMGWDEPARTEAATNVLHVIRSLFASPS